MNISALFIARPIGTTLLTLAVALVGIVSYFLLPVSPLPQVDFPTIRVFARLPGASPETMATTVATPLERSLGRIAGITEMTSSSSLGSVSIVLQFDLTRNIDGAARDVQAAINAARATLPPLPSNPTYWKMNPADTPIMIIALSSDSLPVGSLYDLASNVLSQKIAQVYGVGQVDVGGGSLPAVRVNVNPGKINSMGMSLSNVRDALATANANQPKGTIDDGKTQWFIGANDQLQKASEFAPLIVRERNGTIVRLYDVATVSDSVQDVRMAGYGAGKRAITLVVYRQPGSNIIDTVKRVRENLPLLRAWMPEHVDLNIVMDRSPSITESVKEVEVTLVISMCLVVLVVFLFLHNGRATLIPAVAVPVSLLGTFAVMYISDFSLNHLSLMALTIATGFVVDDAIVVTENIVRYIERGEAPLDAALKGSKEVAFTVISISLSLVAIFVPILGMGGIPGRLFKEFAVTLSAAVLVSLVVSLVTTPMMCAKILKAEADNEDDNSILSPPLYTSLGLIGMVVRPLKHALRVWSDFMDWLHEAYAKSLIKILHHRAITLAALIFTMGLSVYLYIVIPKGFFPQQDTGQIMGQIQADQSISFTAMRPKFLEFLRVLDDHPAVATAAGFIGGRQSNTGMVFITLKPRKERKQDTFTIITDLRQRLSHVPGAVLRMTPMQDVRMGGRQSRAMYQFTLQSDNLQALRDWTPKITDAFKTIPGLLDINSDQDNRGLQTMLEIDREALARYNISFRQVDSTLNMAFGQSFASTILTAANQYRVVLEYEPEYLQGPNSLSQVYVPPAGSPGQGMSRVGNAASSIDTSSSSGMLVPLMAFAKVKSTLTALGVTHQGQFSSATISFNLEQGYTLSDVEPKINAILAAIHVPSEVKGSFQGTAKIYASSMGQQPLLILAALVTLYIVLGVLYESFIHPLTILSTLPSAGVGALLGLMLFGEEFSVIAFIGVLLLSGIVKKNAIMMIDFAVVARREEGLTAMDAIYHACLLRFRPIMMTTMAAVFGAVPLLVASGDGAELRMPLGITIVGGLLVSQLLTLYTTPVVYLYLDRFSREKKSDQSRIAVAKTPEPA